MTARPELLCSVCGVEVVQKADGKAYHVEAIPKEFEYHAPEVVAAADLAEPDDPGPTPGMRQTVALERIAAALEGLLEHARVTRAG